MDLEGECRMNRQAWQQNQELSQMSLSTQEVGWVWGTGEGNVRKWLQTLKTCPCWDISSNKDLSSQGFITFSNCPINGGNTRIQIHEPTGAFLYSKLKQKLCVYSWCPLMSLLLSMIYKIRSKPCLASPFPWMCCFRTGPRIFVVGMGCT